MKKLLLSFFATFALVTGYSQTVEELKAEQAPKKDSIAAIQARINALQSKIDGMPGWKKGAFGTIGGSISSFSNWYAQGAPNNEAGNLGFTVNAYANLKEKKFFWRNSANLNLAWVKLDNKDNPNDSDTFEGTTDVFQVTSLYGRKLTEKFAISGLGEYRTTLLNNFNNPGYLDLGVGATWTPLEDLVVVIHPLNYNFVFADNNAVFESSLGAKIVADYTKKIGAINFKSNLSMFQSYENENLSNITWTNSFGYTLWKMIGVGFDFGLRSNKQEALNFALGQYDATAIPVQTVPTFSNVDNKLQTYWMLGLNYAF